MDMIWLPISTVNIMEEESLAEAGGKKQDTDITLYLSGRMHM